MIFSFKKKKQASVIILKEDIFITNSYELKEALNNLIDEGKKYILIDFREIKYISAKGIFVIIEAFKKIKQEKGDLKILNNSKNIYKIFQSLGINKYIDFFEKEEDAVIAFGKHVGVTERLLLWSIQ